LVSGLFPLIPFLSWGFWGVLMGRVIYHERKLILCGVSMAVIGFALRYIQPFTYSQTGNIYSTSMIILTFGSCSLVLWLTSKLEFSLLARIGKYAWRLTFWRYIILYIPLVLLGLFRTLTGLEALIISITASSAQIGLTYLDRICKYIENRVSINHYYSQ
jgi:Na+-driven multidrug efflux pump